MKISHCSLVAMAAWSFHTLIILDRIEKWQLLPNFAYILTKLLYKRFLRSLLSAVCVLAHFLELHPFDKFLRLFLCKP